MPISVATATDAYAARLAARGVELAPAERRVAESFLELGPEATLLSAAALAALVGTSDATVVRTAKSLGYRGLAEMRRAVAAQGDGPALGERLRRTLEQAPKDELFSTAIRNHLSAVENLTRSISPQDFEDAVAILASRQRVVWRGVGPSAHLAAYAQLLTQRIGKPSCAFVHTGASFADELLTLTPNDAIVAFAYGRLPPHVRVLLEHAEALGASVVLVTDTFGRRVDAAVGATLRCGRGAPGLVASHATTLVVIEALVLAIGAAHQSESETSLLRLNELRAALTGRRRDVETEVAGPLM